MNELEEQPLNCCASQKTGFFCMTCGSRIREQPAHLEILAHCAKQIKMHRGTIRKFNEEIKAGSERKEYCRERVAGANKAIVKYERWRSGIRALMEGKV